MQRQPPCKLLWSNTLSAPMKHRKSNGALQQVPLRRTGRSVLRLARTGSCGRYSTSWRGTRNRILSHGAGGRSYANTTQTIAASTAVVIGRPTPPRRAAPCGSRPPHDRDIPPADREQAGIMTARPPLAAPCRAPRIPTPSSTTTRFGRCTRQLESADTTSTR
jgi:hypothetical protein